MTGWAIKLPVRDPGERLTVKAASELADLLDGEDSTAARELLVALHQAGILLGKSITVHEVGEWLAALEPGQRRRLLDLARRKAGLPSIHQVEQRQSFEAAQRAGDLRRAEDSPWQICHAEGCTAVPTDPVTSLQIAVDARRWFCEQHRDQAQLGDLEPRPPLRMSPSGLGVIDEAEEEAEQMRQAADARRRAAEREAKLAERAAEQAERDAHERALAELWRPDNLIGS